MEESSSRFDQRITKVELNVGKLEAKIYEIQSEKATYAKLDELEQKIKSSPEKLEKRIPNVTDWAPGRAYDDKKSALKNELYSKRFGFLIYGVKGKSNNMWETKQESTILAIIFFKEAIRIDNQMQFILQICIVF